MATWPALNGLQSPAEEHLCSAVPSKTTQTFFGTQTFLDPLPHLHLVQPSLERSLEEIFKAFSQIRD